MPKNLKISPKPIKISFSNENNYSNPSSRRHFPKKRKLKNSFEIKTLISEFNKSSSWDHNFIQNISEKLKMSFTQVYKWHWEYSKKLLKQNKTLDLDFKCKETLIPLPLEKKFYINQQQYASQLFKPI